ncbi:helix-turn-helix domain-containing protein [Gellertiella hungarica]|uniref:Transcriptional regulator with XRE-family HTH domain n=1 Tax=Gellertiella hungarica TaxID=1572859 RepID=A0A7W6J719_9HYPH|nr:helix-turn-helix transcriptional regulator [Gellertiella hungarica]MBB4065984.1 transcriptional regulator with XRE-family HTH domain [Gellertiella hungarica]
MTSDTQSVGTLLRTWRQRRRFSQLALASEAEISQRHLSFLESGRSRPSRDMVLRLAEYLNVPLEERNAMLRAAGFAPVYLERALSAPELQSAMSVVRRILEATEPHPALAVDRNWTLLSANAAVGMLTRGAAAHLLEGPVNVLRLSLHPEGLAPRILNYREWRDHILARLSHDIEVRADGALARLRAELAAYPVPDHSAPRRPGPLTGQDIAIPLRIASPAGPLEFLSTTTVFGTAEDITLAGVVIESFYPANPETAAAMQALNRAGTEPIP